VAWNDWLDRVEKLLDEARNPPFRASERLPGSATLSYGPVLAFDRVVEARQDWEKARQRLEDLRDLAVALGMTGPQPGKPSLLRIPPGFTVEQASARLQELKTAYPRHAEWTAADILSRWTAAGLPEAVAGELRRAAEASYRNLIRAGQELVLRQLQRVSPDGRETPERWREVRAWLVTTTQLTEWDRLAVLLARLADPRAESPVAALAAFLAQDRIDLDLQSFTLQVPDELRVRPAGRLTIYYRTGSDVLTFRRFGDDQRDPRRRVTMYTFIPDAGKAIVYQPGDKLWAELPLKDSADRDLLFTWARSRSLTYQFERLLRPPRLHRKDQDNTAGDLKEDVVLTVVPERGAPRLPDLLPVVELQKR
jgi:hypothetical protein